MYGYRARLGLIVPSSNTTNEPEFWRWIPKGVSISTARMTLENVREDELVDMADDVEQAVEQLSTADVDAIAFGCTTGSLVKGAGYDRQIKEMIEEKAAVPGIATSTAIMSAFDAVGASDLAVATPYTEEMNELEREFLVDNGYGVIDITGLGIEPNLDIGRQSPATAFQLGREVDSPQADAVFLSCTNFRTLEIIESLEADLDKPVISSNSATLWAVLNRMGVNTESIELGKLYERGT